MTYTLPPSPHRFLCCAFRLVSLEKAIWKVCLTRLCLKNTRRTVKHDGYFDSVCLQDILLPTGVKTGGEQFLEALPCAEVIEHTENGFIAGRRAVRFPADVFRSVDV